MATFFKSRMRYLIENDAHKIENKSGIVDRKYSYTDILHLSARKFAVLTTHLLFT
jgi:hypothetical protein